MQLGWFTVEADIHGVQVLARVMCAKRVDRQFTLTAVVIAGMQVVAHATLVLLGGYVHL